MLLLLLTLATFGALAPVMDDIVADFAAVCRPFEVAYKLANNIAVAAALSVTAAAGRNNKQSRK